MILRLLTILCICSSSIFVSIAQSQSVSNLILPTEEEALVAYLAGDISAAEYILLLDLFYGNRALDSLHLPWEIPNVDVIADQRLNELDDLQLEQIAGLYYPDGTTERVSSAALKVSARVTVDQELNAARRSASAYRLKVGDGSGGRPSWGFSGILASVYRREVVWRERNLYWRPFAKSETTVQLGNYDLRWGLGLALGRRGRMLRRQTELTYESFLYPTRSGLNGLLVSGSLGSGAIRAGRVRWLAFGSTWRDSRIVMKTFALGLSREGASWQAGLLFTRTALDRRIGEGSFQQEQYSGYLQKSLQDFKSQMEINAQVNDGSLTIAGAAEGRYQTTGGNVRLAAWVYPADYVNLLGGGRAGQLSEVIRLEDLGFEFSERHHNQRGALVRSLSPLSRQTKLETGLHVSARGSGELRAEYIVAAIHSLTDQRKLKLEGGGRLNHTSSLDKDRWRVRAQLSERRNWGDWRLAVGYSEIDDSRGAVSIFGRLTRKMPHNGRLELWLDLARMESGTELKRFYGYIRMVAPLDMEGSILAVSKVGYSYNENMNASSRVVVRFELQSHW